MKPSVHLIGMGALGSMLAWQLHRANVPFTWEDSDERIAAWEASSGLVYPSGDVHDERNYRYWEEWFASPPWYPLQVLEQGAFWFTTKTPPNNDKHPARSQIGPLRLGARPSYHVNVPSLVRGTRRAFEGVRVDRRPSTSKVCVHSHGFSHRLNRYAWGWTVRTGVALDWRIRDASQGLRPCIYARTSRFKLSYLNPLPWDTTGWIGGSAHIVQKHPRIPDMGDRVERWQAAIEAATQGLVRIGSISTPIDGWRPSAKKDDPYNERTIQDANGEFWLPPMGGNGIRHAPLLIQQTSWEIQTQL